MEFFFSKLCLRALYDRAILSCKDFVQDIAQSETWRVSNPGRVPEIPVGEHFATLLSPRINVESADHDFSTGVGRALRGVRSMLEVTRMKYEVPSHKMVSWQYRVEGYNAIFDSDCLTMARIGDKDRQDSRHGLRTA